MQFLSRTHARLVEKFGQKKVLFGATILGILVAFLAAQLFNSEEAPGALKATEKAVTVSYVRDLMGSGGSIAILGRVEAVNEARLVTEAGGRVTSVPVELGARVNAGAVIATIENSRERAAVLQAQGVYEAAQAGAASSDVGSASAERAYSEALTQAVNTYRGAFASADDVLRNTVDQVFSNPNSGQMGVRIDANGRANELIEERKALETIFEDWQAKVGTDISGNVSVLLTKAENDTTRLAAFVLTLTSLLSEEDASPDESELLALRSDFAAARTGLNGTLQSLSTARTALISSKAALDQARIGATKGDVSLAEAQVKQALGALRLAQASLEKTIVRSPISGTINTLSLKAGSTISPGVPAAVVSSAGGLQVVAYINESDAERVKVGSQALIEGKVNGVVTHVASGVDAETKKIEVRIGLSMSETIILTGETVNVSIEGAESSDEASEVISLPVVAIKMTPEGPIVFTVSDDKKLIPHSVTLGAVLSDHIVIEDGVTEEMAIVTDARGLRASEIVTIK